MFVRRGEVDEARGKPAQTRIEPLGPVLPDGTQLVRCTPLQVKRRLFETYRPSLLAAEITALSDCVKRSKKGVNPTMTLKEMTH